MQKRENFEKISKKFTTSQKDYIVSFRKNVELLKESKNLTLREISEGSGIPYSTLNTVLYDPDIKDIKASTAVSLAKYFKISVDELLGSDTIDPIAKRSLAYCRRLSEANLYTVNYIINNLYRRQKTDVHGSKIINVMIPECSHGSLIETNVFEPFCIDYLSDSKKSKVFLGIRIVCDHYMPRFTPYDTLLIASDRDAYDGELCVILYYGKIFITKKSIKYIDGQKEISYIGILDKNFKVSENEIDSKIGYVVDVYSDQEVITGVIWE